MKHSLSRSLLVCAVSGLTVSVQAQAPGPGPDMIVTRASQKSPDQVVDAVKAYAETKKWLYMGANKAKQGEVTMVKVCIPQVGQVLWPVGLHLSAILPCGNLGVYKQGGQTQVSMLHPQYMQVLYPHAEVEKAVGVATPLLMDMLAEVSR